jgi:molybdopterin molybdotransferase
MAQLSDDCCAFGGPWLPIEAARRLIFKRVGVVAGVETIGLAEAHGRTLTRCEPGMAVDFIPYGEPL